MALAPTINENGITVPSFEEILTELQDAYRGIYGEDVYLGNDSQDGQFLGVIALAVSDCNAAALSIYQSFSPQTAQGEGLSSRVKMNGISRLVATQSQADILIVGQVGTVITNGIVADEDNNNWLLPASITIPLAGEITVTATAEDVGALTAQANTITRIITPVFGWQSATNPADAVPGQPVETDAALRLRQALSVAVPSQTIFEGIVGSVANIPGVTRIKGYENDADVTDSNGIPSHSIAIIVEGGEADDIFLTIANKKTPGTGTFGSLEETVIDDVGSPHIIRFSRPDLIDVKIDITIQPLSGYSTPILDQVKAELVAFVAGLDIGESLLYSRVFVPANLNNSAIGETYNITQLQIAKLADPLGTADITIGFDEAAALDAANVTFTVL